MTTQIGFKVDCSFRIERGVWVKIDRIDGAVFNHIGENVVDQVKNWLVETAIDLVKRHYPRAEAVRITAHLAHGNTEYGNRKGEFSHTIEYFVEREMFKW